MFIRVQTWLIRIRTAPVSLLSQLHITFEQISSCHRRSVLHYWNVLTRFKSTSSINTVIHRLNSETFSFEPRFLILGGKIRKTLLGWIPIFLFDPKISNEAWRWFSFQSKNEWSIRVYADHMESEFSNIPYETAWCLCCFVIFKS